MKCISPIHLKNNRKFTAQYNMHALPCGKCVNCIKRRARDWVFRMEQEKRDAKTSLFLTLTYSDEKLIHDIRSHKPTLSVSQHQNFMKSLRKAQKEFTDDKIRFYMCGEYGEQFGRPHYHYILFNIHPICAHEDFITQKLWRKGFAYGGSVSSDSIAYVTGYVNKKIEAPNPTFDGRRREFSAMSKGIGKNFLTERTRKFYHSKELPYLILEGGTKQQMPRYYKRKIYGDKTIELARTNAKAQDYAVDHEVSYKTEFELKKLAVDKQARNEAHRQKKNKYKKVNFTR